MPQTLPLSRITGPPLLPQLTDMFICRSGTAPRHPCRCARAEMYPLENVKSEHSDGFPIAIACRPTATCVRRAVAQAEGLSFHRHGLRRHHERRHDPRTASSPHDAAGELSAARVPGLHHPCPGRPRARRS